MQFKLHVLIFTLVTLLTLSTLATAKPNSKFISSCPTTKSFDFPVGAPNAKNYYNAQKFGKNHHLGDDWNGKGGGNTDLGDPVYAISDGIVSSSEDIKGGLQNYGSFC